MIFLQAMWHSARVIGASLYWLLSLGLVWAGFAQLGTAPVWGWACFGLVALATAARMIAAPKFISHPAGYVLATGLYLAAMILALVITPSR